jgi:hypothetical protein
MAGALLCSIAPTIALVNPQRQAFIWQLPLLGNRLFVTNLKCGLSFSNKEKLEIKIHTRLGIDESMKQQLPTLY